jgi:DNA-binding NarL/FixJ family response regulator
MNKIRALIADDEPLARRGIRQLLERTTTLRLSARLGMVAKRCLPYES